MKTNEIINKMQNIVNRNLKGYKTDFTCYDKATVKEVDAKNETTAFIWIVRKLGTHLVTLDENGNPLNKDYLKAIRDVWPEHKEYKITHKEGTWTFKKIA